MAAAGDDAMGCFPDSRDEGGDDEGPPECVATCDWSTGCPDPAVCDTAACPADGDPSKDQIDAFLAAGCQDEPDGSG